MIVVFCDLETAPAIALATAGRSMNPLSALECAVTNFTSVSSLDSAVTNLATSISKHKTLSPFRMNSYRIYLRKSFGMRSYKNRGWGGFLVAIKYLLINPCGSYSYVIPSSQTLMAHTLAERWGATDRGVARPDTHHRDAREAPEGEPYEGEARFVLGCKIVWEDGRSDVV